MSAFPAAPSAQSRQAELSWSWWWWWHQALALNSPLVSAAAWQGCFAPQRSWNAWKVCLL